MLLLRCLHLRSVLVQPFHADLAEARASHAGIYHGNQLWWHTALERLTQHGLLDTSLLQAQRLLPGLFLLLLPLVFLGLCDEPMPHGFLLAVPLVWWLWDYAQGLVEGSSRRRWWRRRRRRWLSAWVGQGHGRRRRQAAMPSRHSVGVVVAGTARVADRQRGHVRRVDSWIQRGTRKRV